MQELFALLRCTSLVEDVILVLLAEITKGGSDRVGCGLAESAEAGHFHVRCKFLDLVQLFDRSFALGDVVEHLQETVCADTAG